MKSNATRVTWTLWQLESVAKISNLQYIEVLQSYGNPIYWCVAILWSYQYIEMRQYIEAFQCIGRTIGLQHFNILGYHRIAILQYIANYLFLRRTLTVHAFILPMFGRDGSSYSWVEIKVWDLCAFVQLYS